MKRVKITIMTMFLSAFLLINAHAGDRQVGSLLLGSGVGAIVGQAAGRNTESTIVGATLGGIVGLLVGSEVRRQHRSMNYSTEFANVSQRYSSHYPLNRRPVFKDNYPDNYRRTTGHPPHIRHNKENCNKIVTIQRGRYKTKRVISTVCRNSPRHEYKYHGPHRYDNRYSQ